MSKTDLQRAYILHQRPFSETSAILDCLTERDGRISVIAKGMRRRRQTKAQLFTEYWLRFGGKSELKQLYQLDHIMPQLPLAGMALSSGFYLNELLLCLIGKEEPVVQLWRNYQHVMTALREPQLIAPLLREFELSLAAELGYGFRLDETRKGEPLDAEAEYSFEFSHGIEPYNPQTVTSKMLVLRGAELLAIQERNWSHPTVARAAKQLLRQVIDHLLDGKPLKSRDYARVLAESQTV